MPEFFADPAGGLLGLLVGALVPALIYLFIHKDRNTTASWKNISDSEKAFRETLIEEVASLKKEIEQLRIELAEYQKQHAEDEQQIRELQNRMNNEH